MALRLACDAADTFASVSAYAGASPTEFGQACSPSRAIGVGVFHGADDLVVSPALGEEARDEWVARNGCAPIPVSVPVSDGELLRYTPCEAGVEVWWRLYPGQGHLWPTGERGEEILNRMWAFFAANPRP